jgi:hypothetical protein
MSTLNVADIAYAIVYSPYASDVTAANSTHKAVITSYITNRMTSLSVVLFINLR